MADRSYSDAFKALRNVYLEDSWVLDIAAGERTLRFVLEAVLTEEHPLYRPPRPGERHCYLLVLLTVSSDEPITFKRSGSLPALDASGTTDDGNIDTFAEIASNQWELTGDWGSARVTRPTVVLEPRK